MEGEVESRVGNLDIRIEYMRNVSCMKHSPRPSILRPPSQTSSFGAGRPGGGNTSNLSTTYRNGVLADGPIYLMSTYK